MIAHFRGVSVNRLVRLLKLLDSDRAFFSSADLTSAQIATMRTEQRDVVLDSGGCNRLCRAIFLGDVLKCQNPDVLSGSMVYAVSVRLPEKVSVGRWASKADDRLLYDFPLPPQFFSRVRRILGE